MRERDLPDHHAIRVSHCRVGACESGRCAPAARWGRDGADEEVDEQWFGDFGAVDFDVDEVLMAHGICGAGGGGGGRVERTAAGEAAFGVVKLVECCAGVGGELRGGDAPVDEFGVGVSKWAGRASGEGGVEDSGGVGVEGG